MSNRIISILLVSILFNCESPDTNFRVKRNIDRNYSHLSYNKLHYNYNKIRDVSQEINQEKEGFSNELSDELLNPKKTTKYPGYYKIGQPYQIDGISYVPQKYNYLEEIGEASWYGEKFHGKKTANGEIYNMNELTAAHRTMPLPSIAEVTNLANGKSIKVRINDRGPFANDRIIDLSKESAKKLDFKEKGVINVRVKYLAEETEELLQKLGLKLK